MFNILSPTLANMVYGKQFRDFKFNGPSHISKTLVIHKIRMSEPGRLSTVAGASRKLPSWMDLLPAQVWCLNVARTLMFTKITK